MDGKAALSLLPREAKLPDPVNGCVLCSSLVTVMSPRCSPHLVPDSLSHAVGCAAALAAERGAERGRARDARVRLRAAGAARPRRAAAPALAAGQRVPRVRAAGGGGRRGDAALPAGARRAAGPARAAAGRLRPALARAAAGARHSCAPLVLRATTAGLYTDFCVSRNPFRQAGDYVV